MRNIGNKWNWNNKTKLDTRDTYKNKILPTQDILLNEIYGSTYNGSFRKCG